MNLKLSFILFTSYLTVATVCQAQSCNGQIQRLQNSFEQTKSECANPNLSYSYVDRREPNFANNLPDCMSLGKACIPHVEGYNSKAATCDAKAKQSTIKNKSGNLRGYSNDVMSAMNGASTCVSSAISDAYDSLHKAEVICMSAEEGIIQANDKCDVAMTTLSIRAQGLQCTSQNASEVTAFQSQRAALVTEINNYNERMNTWGKDVKTKVMANYRSCSTLFNEKVAEKNAAVKNYMAMAGQAFQLKRSIASH